MHPISSYVEPTGGSGDRREIPAADSGEAEMAEREFADGDEGVDEVVVGGRGLVDSVFADGLAFMIDGGVFMTVVEVKREKQQERLTT